MFPCYGQSPNTSNVWGRLLGSRGAAVQALARLAGGWAGQWGFRHGGERLWCGGGAGATRTWSTPRGRKAEPSCTPRSLQLMPTAPVQRGTSGTAV